MPASFQVIRSLVALRLRSSYQHTSWGEKIFWLLLALMLSVVMFLIVMMSSQEGMSTFFALGKQKDAFSQSMKNVFVVDEKQLGVSEEQPSKETPSESIVEQAENLMKVVSASEQPLSSWLFTLQNTKITSHTMVIHVRPANVFTPKQEAILKTQGIVVLPWSDQEALPKSLDTLTQDLHFWVGKRGDKDWVIHGATPDMLTQHTHKNTALNSVDLLRVILWSEELPLQEQWFAENPAPALPENLKPSNVSLGIIQSTVGLQQTFWLLVGFMGLLVGSSAALFGLIFWKNLHAEGAFESLASLPFKTWLLPASYIVQWTIQVFMLMFVSVLVSVGFALFLSVPVPWWNLLKAVVLAGFFSCMMISMSLMVQSWFSKPWWQLWFLPIFSLVIMLMDFVYITFFFESRLIGAFLHSWGLGALLLVLSVVSALMWHQTGRRLDRHGRLGLRKF